LEIPVIKLQSLINTGVYLYLCFGLRLLSLVVVSTMYENILEDQDAPGYSHALLPKFPTTV